MRDDAPGHWACQHRNYRLTCAEYDELYEHAQGRCGICGIKEAFAAQRKLFIDHDHTIGEGSEAVRGLLCSRCNTGIDRRSKPMAGPDVDAYLANPWHSRPRPNLYAVPATRDDEPSPADRLNLLGGQLLRIRRDGRLSSREGRDFVRCQVKPAIRAARRAGIGSRVIAEQTGYRQEYVWLIWSPEPGDPDWTDPMSQQTA